MKLINDLIRYKGLSKRELADILGVGYHSLVKTLHPTPWYTRRGEKKFREGRQVREAIADWLGLPYEKVWGPNAACVLKRLIREEVERQLAA